MSHAVSTLLLRNLDDVFGQIDPVRRRAAIEEIFHEDAVFYEPAGGPYRGHDEIDRIAGVIKAAHPDFQYQPLAPPEEVGDGGRVRWVSGVPGKPRAYAGTDFIIARDGKIAAVYLFFDELPSTAGGPDQVQVRLLSSGPFGYAPAATKQWPICANLALKGLPNSGPSKGPLSVIFGRSSARLEEVRSRLRPASGQDIPDTPPPRA